MAKKNTVIGDVFAVKLDDMHCRYFQYVGNDLTQLNSDVIRVFKKIYTLDSPPDLEEITSGEIAFFAHCVTKWGIDKNLWERVGNIKRVGNWGDALFKMPAQLGAAKGEGWWVWKVNQKMENVSALSGANAMAVNGVVINPNSIANFVKSGTIN